MKAVLDASALLAYLQDEPGSQMVEKVLDDSAISAVNWSEVIQKADSHGVDVAAMSEELSALGLTIEPFTADQAEAAGCLWRKTAKHGLSLGDRACISLAQERGLPVLTADRVWKKLRLRVDIQVVR